MRKGSPPQMGGALREAYERELRMHIARSSYIDYIQYASGGRWEPARHLELVCRELERVMSGETRRLMIFMPPRHGKSATVTETFPSYYLGRNPDGRVIEVSYAEPLAQRFGGLNRAKIEAHGRELFGIGVDRRQSSKTNWNIAGAEGGMISAGYGGPLTGYGADLLIIDDPIQNRLEAESKTFRDRLWGEYQSTIATRLHAGGAIIIILTRWHEDDLAGRLLSPEYGGGAGVGDGIANAGGVPGGWRIISLPAICEDGGDALGRRPGEALWPGRGYDEAWAAAKKLEVGSYAWASLYQQSPAPSGGGIFKRGWWQRWGAEPSDLYDFLQSWDCSFKGLATSDYVVGQVWARRRGRPAELYLLDQVRARMSFTGTAAAVRDLSAKWPRATRKLIEDKANGTAVIDALKREVPGLLAVEPEGGKIARAHAASPAVEAGNVYIPASAPWANDFIDELAAFPNAANDDQADAATQAIIYYTSRPKGANLGSGGSLGKGSYWAGDG